MASIRDIRKRIKSVKSTQKITKAMKMVAAARLRRAQNRVSEGTPYAKKIRELLLNLSQSSNVAHPLLAARDVKKRLLVVLSSDRGLCGAFNASILRTLEREVRSQNEFETTLLIIGRKAKEYVRSRNFSVYRVEEGFWSDFSFERAQKLAREVSAEFIQGEFDRVDVLFNEFLSVITQKPKVVTLLPISKGEEELGEPLEYIYEPNRERLIETLVPRSIDVQFYLQCSNSLASEFGARMTAMDASTRNAGEMIDKLTLEMNRARQAMITNELVEIISGAEALN